IAGDEKLDRFSSQAGLHQEALPCERRFDGGRLVGRGEAIVNGQGSGNLLRCGEDSGRSREEEDGKETGSAEKDTHRPHSHTMSLWKHYLWCERIAHTSKTKEKHRTGCSKSPSSKAAANYRFLRGGWDDPNCARPTRAF